MKEKEYRREVRSYVLRAGRISKGQERAYNTLSGTYCAEYRKEQIDTAVLFERDGDILLDIGFGMGESTIEMARVFSGKNVIGIEVHRPGVGKLLNEIKAGTLRNIRIIQHDAKQVLSDMIPDNSIAGIQILFPDPWPKKKHKKRRLIQDPFVSLCADKLQKGAFLLAATDWEEYAQQILEVFEKNPLLSNTAEKYAEKPFWRNDTRFEAKGKMQQRIIRNILFMKK